jgi:predicted RNase H-like nuclease
LAHQQNLAAVPKLFEARSEIAFCEFESSQLTNPKRITPSFDTTAEDLPFVAKV